MKANYKIALLMTLFAGLATVVGGFFTFFIKRTNLRGLSVGLGFSAGVMIYVSMIEIFPKAKEARAKVIEAEAQVPQAMAEAFRSGNLGIMDYYRMKNIEADTSMRENIAKPSANQGKPLGE
jgi:zinc transporter ZupT